MNTNVFTLTAIEQIEGRLDAVLQAGADPTVAVVFSAPRYQPTDIGAVFARHGIQVFGASAGEGFTQEGVSEGAIVVMLLDIPRDAFQVNLFDASGHKAPQACREVVDWAKTVYADPAFMIMCAGLQADGEALVGQVAQHMGRPVPLFGGIVGIEAGGSDAFVFTADQVSECGVIAMIFDSGVIDLNGVAASGWKGVGTPKTITRAHGNIVYEIDHAPALDMYNKYLNIGTDPTLAYEYPLLLMRGDSSYILRGSIRINDDKSISYGGPVPEGIKVRFSMPPGLEIIDHAVAKVSDLNRLAPAADAMILFSCQGRRYTLGPMVETEIKAIHNLWNVPLVGFFTNGEIGPMPNGRCELHNHTLVPVVIKQR